MKYGGVLFIVILLTGSAFAWQFEPPVRIHADGQPIDTDVGHAAPLMGDWNGEEYSVHGWVWLFQAIPPSDDDGALPVTETKQGFSIASDPDRGFPPLNFAPTAWFRGGLAAFCDL